MTDKNCYSKNDEEAVVLISLKANDITKKRNPQNFIFIIDISGSMSGQSIKLVKEVLMFAKDQLTKGDTITIITFNDKAKIILNEHKMGEKIKQEETYWFDKLSLSDVDEIESINRIVKNINAKSGTNIGDALKEGLAKYIDISEKNTNYTSILLLTDGSPGEGMTDTVELIEYARKLSGEIIIPITTFGLGGDHDAKLLKGLSEIGKGSYFYVKNLNNIKETFANFLGGTLVKTATKIAISPKGHKFIEFAGYYKIETILSFLK